MTLSISIFGLGYVGSVSAACFAHLGHRVIGVDVNSAKVGMIESGRSPIVEARMDELVSSAHRACRLHATTDSRSAVHETQISFICVGTPCLRSGKLDLRHVEHVCGEIGAALCEKKTHHVVVLRSTVLPGTTESIVIPALEKASGQREGDAFTVCYNPEFIREGSAVSDFLHPPYMILGATDLKAIAPLRELYKEIPTAFHETTVSIAEMVKYVSNVFHALKVGFANEIGTLCKALGLDSASVTRIFTSDTSLNISPAYLSPGFAFGGSCLPKDLRALAYRAKELDLSLPLIEAILPSNAEHANRAFEAILETGKRSIGVLGLSFKAGTDDLRESPQVQLIKRLLGEGFRVRVWDQDVSLGQLAGSNRKYIEEIIPHIGSLLSIDLEQVVRYAEVVVVGTKSVSAARLDAFLSPNQVVLDLVNLEPSARPQIPLACKGICW